MAGFQKDKVVGELAVERGYVSPEQLAEAVGDQRVLREQMGLDQSLAQVLVGKHWLGASTDPGT